MLLFYIIGYLVLFLIVMFFSVKYAPLGYEDENGFHYSFENNSKRKK